MPREIIEDICCDVSFTRFLSSLVKIQNLRSSFSELKVYQLFILIFVDAKLYVRQNHDPKTRNERGIKIL